MNKLKAVYEAKLENAESKIIRKNPEFFNLKPLIFFSYVIGMIANMQDEMNQMKKSKMTVF